MDTSINSIDQHSAFHSVPAIGVADQQSEDSDIPEHATSDQPVLGPADIGLILAAVVALPLLVTRKWLRLPAVSAEIPKSDDWLMMLGLVFVIYAAQMVGGMIGGSVAGEPPDAANAFAQTRWSVIVRSGVYSAAIVPVVATWMWRCRRGSALYLTSVSDASPRTRAARAVLVGSVGFLLAYPILSTAGVVTRLLVYVATGNAGNSMAHDQLVLLTESTWTAWHWLSVGLIVCGAPLIEETMYRGLIQQGIVHLTRSRWMGIVLASVVFTVMHIPAIPPGGRYALAPLFVLSLAFGVIMERTQTLLAPIVAHMLFNALNILLAVVASGADTP